MASDPVRGSNPSLNGNSDAPPALGGGLGWRLVGVVRSMRPHQWIKNLFVVAPAFFAKDIFKQDLLLRAFGGFAVFCLLASAIYTINDLLDVESDRAHPVKRYRPIASGRVPVPVARGLAVVLVAASLAGACLLPWGFALTAVGYFTMNLAYSVRLKKIAYIDVGCIAAGFVLRVVAGGFATSVHVSLYILACTALLALFLGFGKRRHELAQAARNSNGDAAKQRKSLQAYSPRALTVALALTGVTTVLTYVAYTLDPATRAVFKSDWLWLTTPCVIVGVFRFLFLVARRPKAESPTQEMLRDVPFMMNLVIWIAIVTTIVYRLRIAE